MLTDQINGRREAPPLQESAQPLPAPCLWEKGPDPAVKTPSARMDELIQALHQTYLKPRGYKKDRTSFRLFLPDGLCKIVNFQRNFYNTGDHCRFAINLGVYYESQAPVQNRAFKEYECVLRRRPSVSPYPEFWSIQPDTDLNALWSNVDTCFREIVLPWLDQFSTKESAIEKSIEWFGRGPVYPITVAELLISCGYGKALLPKLREEAKKRPRDQERFSQVIQKIEAPEG